MKNIIFTIALIVFGLNAGFANVDTDNKPTKFRILAISASNDSIISASNIITLFQPFSVEFPTAFTPNGDGLNDSFGAVAKGVEDYKLIIYNRFGDIVFTSSNIEMKWDGKIKGVSAPSGAYVYQVYAEGQEGTTVNRSGKVTLIN